MKKLFSLILVSVLFTVTTPAKAQSSVVTSMLSNYGNALDTVTNTATNYVYVHLTTTGWTNVSVQPVITKLSGTGAGTYYLQASLDGTNYRSIIGDSVTATNITTNTFIWKEATTAYKYYRVGYTGSGTMSSTLKGYFFTNNPNR